MTIDCDTLDHCAVLPPHVRAAALGKRQDVARIAGDALTADNSRRADVFLALHPYHFFNIKEIRCPFFA